MHPELEESIRKLVDARILDQLRRHANAGIHLSRKEVCRMVLREMQEEFTRQAEVHDTNDDSESADMCRELSRFLPQIFRQVGLS